MSRAKIVGVALVCALAASGCGKKKSSRELGDGLGSSSSSSGAAAAPTATSAGESSFEKRVASLTTSMVEGRLAARGFTILARSPITGGTKLTISRPGSSVDQKTVAVVALTTEPSPDRAKALAAELSRKAGVDGATAIAGGSNVLFVRCDRAPGYVQTPYARGNAASDIAVTVMN